MRPMGFSRLNYGLGSDLRYAHNLRYVIYGCRLGNAR